MSEDQRTMDGVAVTLGDTAWCSTTTRSCKLQKHHLGMWWSWFQKEIWSTERAALKAAVEREQAALAKAKREVRRAGKAVDRLRARLGTLGSPP